MYPFADAEAARRRSYYSKHKRAANDRDEPFRASHPSGARTNGVRNIRGHDQTDAGQNRNRKDPEIPRHHERDKIVEGGLGPLIQTAFQRQ